MNEVPDMNMEEPDIERMEAASDWLMKFHGQSLSEEEMTDWIRWCESDPANLEAFERLRAVWRRYGSLRSAGGTARGALRRADSPTSRRRRRHWRPLTAGLAASLIAAVLGGYLWFQHGSSRELVAQQVNKSAVLPDGSSLELGAKTAVAVNFSGPQRDLTMSTGQAYFKVHHDKIRPFVVRAGVLSITAVGTAFDVRREADRVVVTVEEGVVQIARNDSPGATWRAGAGYQLAYSERQQTAIVAVVNAPAVLAWREGQLVYESEPLGSVVDDVNRYSAHKIVIRDERTAALVFNGTVFTTSIDDWLASVTTAFHLRAVRQPNGDLLLEPS